MPSKIAYRHFGTTLVLLTRLIAASPLLAAPTAEQALKLTPIQADVVYDRPNESQKAA